ncbi:MAG: trypsin-like peptidase domain-containing protein [Vicinamibacterales bacterium]
MRRLSAFTAVAILAAALCEGAGLDIANARRGVVRLFIFTPNPNRPGTLRLEGTGSGFVINERGTIVTNDHVIADLVGKQGAVRVLYADTAEAIAARVRTREDLSRELGSLPEASIVDHDAQIDLAILEPKSAGQTTVFALAPKQFVEAGDRVRAFGYPGLSDDLAPSASVTMSQPSGEVMSTFHYDLMNVDVFRITAEIGHGMSGGPLVNECGEVVAINGEGAARSFDEPGKAQGLDVERANYSIVTDALIPMLERNRVPYRAVTERCATGAAASGRDALLTGGVITSMLLGATALVLAFTRQGRAAVKNASEAVSRRLSSRSAGGELAKKGGILPLQKNGRAKEQQQESAPVAAELSGPRLCGLSGEFAGVELELTDDPVIIGRDPRVSQLVFSTDTPSISGRHCSIRFDPDHQAVVVQDLWSTNGTFLQSGRQIPAGEPALLRSTDQFYLSEPGVRFEVRY